MNALLLLAALAQDLDAAAEMPALYRVDGLDWPGAVTRTHNASILDVPPPHGVPWTAEPDVRLDGWPSIQAVEVLNADLWHARGWTGQGVRVAVFDLGWFGTEADPAVLGDVVTADCFRHTSCELPIENVRPRFGIEAGEHGFACAHTLQSVAPDVELFLVRVNGLATFQNAAAWAIRNDIDLISMSMSFYNSSFYDGTGPFTAPVLDLAAASVLLVTSAGNSARQHWSGPWRDADADGRLDGTGDNAIWVELRGGGRRTVYITWSEYQACGDSDLDVIAYDPEGFIVGRSAANQDVDAESCSPSERLAIEASADGVYRIEIVARRVATAGLWVDVNTQAGAIVNGDPAGSIVDPGTHPMVFTVAAVDAEGYLTNGVEGFSSQGPVRSEAPKPDIAGPDGLDSAVYGQRGFFGTSASTPAVTGALALILSRYPDLTPAEAAARLRTYAFNPDVSRVWDPALGAGKARLPDPAADRGPLGCARDQDTLAPALLLLLWRRRRAPRPYAVDRSHPARSA